MPGRLAYVNLFARDIEALSGFYSKLLGFPEIEGHRSPIYRCLDAGGAELGFNALKAYELLGLASRQPTDAAPSPVTGYFTFEMGSPGEVEDAARRAAELGGSLVKPPYRTYYNAWQAVLCDPEGNVFRLNHRMGPRPAFETTGMKFD